MRSGLWEVFDFLKSTELHENSLNFDELVKSRIFHREHGNHRDNQLIKQAILCVLCELCGEQ